MHDVFISYSTKDMAPTEKIRDSLEQNGIPCWMAPRDIPGGSNYAREIPQAIRNCQVFLLILSGNAQSSNWVVKELDNAVNCGKVIIPLMLEDCPLNDEFNFLLTGAQRYSAYCRSAEVLNTLVERIRAITGTKAPCAPEAPAQPAAAAPAQPAPKPQPEKKKAGVKEATPVVQKAKPQKPKKVKEKIPFVFGKTEALAAIAIPVMAAVSALGYLWGNYAYHSGARGTLFMDESDLMALVIYILLGAAWGAFFWWEWIRFRHRELANAPIDAACPACGSDKVKVSLFRTRRITWAERLTVVVIPVFALLGILVQPFWEPILAGILDTYWVQSWMRWSMLYAGALQGLAVGLWCANCLVRKLRRRKGLRFSVCRCKSCRASFLPVMKAK